MIYNAFAIIVDGAARYPVNPRVEFPGISFPLEVTDDTYLPLNCVPVLVDDEPPIDKYTYNVPLDPEFRDGAWRQGWVRTALSQDQIDRLGISDA